MTGKLDQYSRIYPVHRETYAFTKIVSHFNLKPLHEYTAEEARQTYKQFFSAEVVVGAFDGEVQELNIPSPSSPEGIPASVYKPSNLESSPPILVFFHGGGLIILDWKCYENPLKKLASATSCIVVNVEYRLLPYPGKGHDPFDDAVVATKWVLENREKVGGSSDSLVGVAGDSAGGQIAATVSNEVRGLAFQVLIYPHVDLSLQQPSVEEFADCPHLSRADLEWVNKYIAQTLPDYLTDPRVNPILRPDLRSSPTTLVVLAQLDPIRDCGLAYVKKLRAAGVKVQLLMVEGVPHGFFTAPTIFKSTAGRAFQSVSQFLKEIQVSSG